MIKMTSKRILTGIFGLLVAQAMAQGYDVAAYVWPAYQPEPRWAELGIFKDGKGEWQNLYEAKHHFPDDYWGVKPLWGYESDSDPIAVARKIDAATAAGVNVFIYDWYWYGGRPFLENALDEGFLKASNCGRMKFYIMWANHNVNGLWDNRAGGDGKFKTIWPAKLSAEEFHKVVDRWIAKYFRLPNYYKIKGCPVLMIYDIKALASWWGEEMAKTELAWLRARVKEAGFPGLHLQRNFSARNEEVDAFGCDSTTSYNWGELAGDRLLEKGSQPNYAEWGEIAISKLDKARVKAAKTDAIYFPNISCGWDTNARFLPSESQPIVHGANPKDFERFAREVRDWATKNLPADMPHLITVNSWNEWTEGSYLEPDDRFGYGYLNALWRVFVKECK